MEFIIPCAFLTTLFIFVMVVNSSNAKIFVRLRSETQCPMPGYFRDEADCRKFYRCAEHPTVILGKNIYSKAEFNCPAGTIFDEALSICNHIIFAQNFPSECRRYANLTDTSTTIAKPQTDSTAATLKPLPSSTSTSTPSNLESHSSPPSTGPEQLNPIVQNHPSLLPVLPDLINPPSLPIHLKPILPNPLPSLSIPINPTVQRPPSPTDPSIVHVNIQQPAQLAPTAISPVATPGNLQMVSVAMITDNNLQNQTTNPSPEENLSSFVHNVSSTSNVAPSGWIIPGSFPQSGWIVPDNFPSFYSILPPPLQLLQRSAISAPLFLGI